MDTANATIWAFCQRSWKLVGGEATPLPDWAGQGRWGPLWWTGLGWWGPVSGLWGGEVARGGN